MNLTPLSQLGPSRLNDLAALHHATMHTLLADLGLPVVQRYYQICQRDPSVIGVCGISPLPMGVGAEILGWAVGSPHPEAINAQLRTPLPWFAGQMLRLALTRPGTLLQLAQSVLAPSEANALRPGQIELTYIGVAESARGQGLGKGLLIAFLKASRAAGHTSAALSVETDNPAALALYAQAGFKVTKSFREGRFERQRMELAL